MKQLCIDLEHYETDQWAADAILKREILTGAVVDPCVGTGILTVAARAAGYSCIAGDIHDWGFDGTIVGDFLDPAAYLGRSVRDNTVLMNPPFSKAEDFVRQSFAFGARKIVTFQRFSWWESRERRAFWDEFPPTKVYICCNRATCWRHDLTADQRKGSTSSVHAFFVFESCHRGGTLLDRIYKPVKGV